MYKNQPCSFLYLELLICEKYISSLLSTPKRDRKEADKDDLNISGYEDDPFGPKTTNDLDELLAELDVGYEHRLAAFRALRKEAH